MSSRPLTPPERQLARSVFLDAIDLDPVRINNRKWWPFQPKRVTMAPNGHVWFHPEGALYCDCFGHASPSLQALLVHELVHVWQHQRGVYLPIARHPFCRYDYTLKPGWELERYGIEQQAEIVKHAWMLRQGFSIPGAPPLSQYESVLPFKNSLTTIDGR